MGVGGAPAVRRFGGPEQPKPPGRATTPPLSVKKTVQKTARRGPDGPIHDRDHEYGLAELRNLKVLDRYDAALVPTMPPTATGSKAAAWPGPSTGCRPARRRSGSTLHLPDGGGEGLQSRERDHGRWRQGVEDEACLEIRAAAGAAAR